MICLGPRRDIDHDLRLRPYVGGMSDEQPTGSFIGATVIRGVRYEIFGGFSEDLRDGYVRFDVYDEEGNHLTKNFVLDHVPSDGEIWALAWRWHASRTVLVVPTMCGWRLVWVGDEVKLGLDAPWWPLL
jgi:hypothetical protein